MAQPVVFHTQFSMPMAPFTVLKLDSFDFVQRPRPITQPGPHTIQILHDQDLEFDPTIEDETADIADQDTGATNTTACPVNWKPSCAFHLHCTLSPKPRSPYCFLHHQICARAAKSIVRENQSEKSHEWRKSVPSRQSSVTFFLPAIYHQY